MKIPQNDKMDYDTEPVEGECDMRDQVVAPTPVSNDTGIILAIREASGGMILEAQAPKEKLHERSVVVGRIDSKNTQMALRRHFRRFITEWLSRVANNPAN